MRSRLLFALFLLITPFFSKAQMVATDVFLQGQWLEIGVDDMGAFGTCSSPIGYHPHDCYCTNVCLNSGAELDAAYDWGHDGWSVGSPCMMGNYTIPGFPQEGWGMQIGATEYRNWASGGVCTCTFGCTIMPGAISAYSNTGGTIKGIWTGGVAGLAVNQETRVDTLASWVVVTAKIHNTTGGAITNVWYERTCDPDNASMWDGSSNTTNVIVHQNEDATHRVMVGTYSTNTSFSTPTITFNYYNSYLGLCTKDCRAKCGVLTGGLSPSVTPSALWSGSSSVTALGDSSNNDVGIWLVFNIGTIAAGDSAVVSYAYVYDGHSGVDSAFPDPQLSVYGTGLPLNTEPYPSHDSILACSYPGATFIPARRFFHSTDKVWTYSPMDVVSRYRTFQYNRRFRHY